MNRKMNVVPNLLTISRIIMTIFLIFSLKQLYIVVILSMLIFITDFFDGKIARRLNATSKHGEILDIAADLFYIMGFGCSLYFEGIYPSLFIWLPILELEVFIYTSYKSKYSNTFICFDLLGRYLAIVYYVMPLIVYVSWSLSENLFYDLVLAKGKYIYVIFTIVVIIYRMTLIYNPFYVHRKTSD